MISLVRVDDRLIHGQVTVGWAPYLKATRIVVCSDRLAGNPVLSSIVKAGGTEDLQIDVFAVDEAARLFRQGDFEEGRVIVLMENLDDVDRALKAGMTFNSLNLGGLRGRGDGRRLSDAVFLTPSDQEMLRMLLGKGVVTEVRLMPGDRPSYFPARKGAE
jgi:PTS system mannose-specific IIB component